jgi:hypothetical protein
MTRTVQMRCPCGVESEEAVSTELLERWYVDHVAREHPERLELAIEQVLFRHPGLIPLEADLHSQVHEDGTVTATCQQCPAVFEAKDQEAARCWLRDHAIDLHQDTDAVYRWNEERRSRESLS